MRKLATTLTFSFLLIASAATEAEAACDYNWVGSSYQNACPSSWYGTNDGCDCGCQWTDPDCGGATGGGATSGTRIGAIGDSISAGMDSNDDCDTLVECAGKIGEDRAYSWTTGYALDTSIRNKLGMSQTNEQQRNGSRWDDAPGQAQNLLNAGGANVVTIELGGNDVCRKLNDTLPTRAEIEGYIDQTLTTLTNGLPAGSTIILAEAPDVVHLRDTMRYADNFLFETCQDLWDLDTSRLEVNTCDWGFFDFLCDIADFVIEATADFVSPLTNYMLAQFEVEFPCGYVLSKYSNDTKRALARQLNNDINAAIAAKAAQYQGRNGINIKFAANVYEYQFTVGDVSKIDCFHPNRQGQRNLASTVYNGAAVGANSTAVAQDTTAPALAQSPQHWWAESYTAVYSTFYTTENAALEVWSENCYDSYDPCYNFCYEGTTNETPTYHDIRVQGLNYSDWWSIWVQPIDTAGNRGGWYASSCM